MPVEVQRTLVDSVKLVEQIGCIVTGQHLFVSPFEADPMGELHCQFLSVQHGDPSTVIQINVPMREAKEFARAILEMAD